MKPGKSFQMPNKLQKAMIALISALKVEHAQYFFLSDIQHGLTYLTTHPRAAKNLIRAMRDHLQYGDLDLLLIDGIRLHNQDNRDRPDNSIQLQTNLSKLIPDCIHPLNNPLVPFQDQLNLSSTCKYYFKKHEELLGNQLTIRGELHRQQSLRTKKQEYRQVPSARVFASTPVDPQGIKFFKQEGLDFGPNTLRDIKNKLITEKDAIEIAAGQKSDKALRDEFGMLTDPQFFAMVEGLNTEQLDALQKYVVDRFISRQGLIQLPKNELLAIVTVLANKHCQQLIDCGELKPRTVKNYLALHRILNHPSIQALNDKQQLQILKLISVQGIEKFARILALPDMEACRKTFNLSFTSLANATEDGARALCEIKKFSSSNKVKIPAERILTLTSDEAKILFFPEMERLVFRTHPEIQIEEVFQLSDNAKKVLATSTLVWSQMFHDPDSTYTKRDFFLQFSNSTSAGMAALADPDLQDLLMSEVNSGQVKLEQIFRLTESGLALLRKRLTDPTVDLGFFRKDQENCIIS